MSANVRKPQQQRSIDKKNRIIEAGYRLFARCGYFATNTAQIAKEAGVSTGIVYGYFHDKRDILLEVLELYVGYAFAPTFELLEKEQKLDFATLIPAIIDCVVATHAKNQAMHQILHSLSATDGQVSEKFLALEKHMTEKTAQKLRALGYERGDLYERVHLAMEIIQSYAHECVFDKHSYINYDAMRTLVTQMLIDLFQKQ